MLEPILKGLVEWIYEMMIDIMAYASGELLGVMSMDLSYFERTAPIISDIVDVFIALGWALLIGNLVFQSLKVIVSGAGFEAEEPKILFLRTFFFSFLLLASRLICDIGSSITGTIIDMLDLPDTITVTTPDESMFSLGSGAKWLLVIIVGVVLMVQMVKLLFEIGERYVITSVLTFFAPLAFSMGGSKNTNDIFKGWCRMYASMLVMMIMNIVFLKLIMLAMSQMAAGGVLVWLVFVVALTRVARKIDSHIGKIGLNPAQTGNEIGSHIPGVMTAIVIRTMGSLVSRSAANTKGGSSGKTGKGGSSGSGGKSGKNGNSGGKSRNQNPKGSKPNNGQDRNGNNTNGGKSGDNKGSSNNYSGKGGTNVNRGGSNTNVGGTNVDETTNKGERTPYGKDKGIAKNGGGINKSHNNDRHGGYSARNQTVNKDNPQNNSSETKQGKNIPARPPIPRDTSGKHSPGVNAVHGKGASSTQRNPEASNQGGEVYKNKSTVKGSNQTNPSHVTHGGTNQNVPAGNRQGSGKTVVNTDLVHKESGVNSSETYVGNRTGGNVQRGDHYNTQIGGNGGGTYVSGGNTQYNSEHKKSERFTDRDTEHFSRQQSSAFNQRHTKEETTEKRIDHEFKHGRYNPAAANRKGKNTYYQKNNPQVSRENNSPQRKRGGNNGKQRKK